MPAILYWLDFVAVPALMLAMLIKAPPTEGFALSFVLSGYLMWVLFEYAMHRWLFHWRGSPFWRPHMTHHKHPFAEDGMPKPGVSLMALGLVCWAAELLLGVHLGYAWGVGFLLGYMSYIVTHHLVHNGTITGPIAQRHELHHRGWHLNFNLMFPLGDLLFGTYKEVDR